MAGRPGAVAASRPKNGESNAVTGKRLAVTHTSAGLRREQAGHCALARCCHGAAIVHWRPRECLIGACVARPTSPLASGLLAPFLQRYPHDGAAVALVPVDTFERSS
jgi:hypothetical protein